MNGIIGMYKKKPEWLKTGDIVKYNAQGMKYKKHAWTTPKVGIVISERIPLVPPAGHLALYPNPETWVQARTIFWNTGDKRDVREDELELVI